MIFWMYLHDLASKSERVGVDMVFFSTYSGVVMILCLIDKIAFYLVQMLRPTARMHALHQAYFFSTQDQNARKESTKFGMIWRFFSFWANQIHCFYFIKLDTRAFAYIVFLFTFDAVRLNICLRCLNSSRFHKFPEFLILIFIWSCQSPRKTCICQFYHPVIKLHDSVWFNVFLAWSVKWWINTD